jgi:hypothetical protein
MSVNKMGDQETGGTGGDDTVLRTAVEVKVLGSEISRQALWALACAASIMLIGPPAVWKDLLDTQDELLALLIFGCVGFGIGVFCLVLESTSPTAFDNQGLLALIGFILTGCGVGSAMTLVFGTFEIVTIAFGAAGLCLSGIALIGSHVEAIKSRMSSAGSNVRNGGNAVGLVVSLILYIVVASVGLSKYPSNSSGVGYDLAVSGVVIGVLCLFGALFGIVQGQALGSSEKYLYMIICLAVTIGASIFPLGVMSKLISSSVALLCAVAFSGLITRNLFHHSV